MAFNVLLLVGAAAAAMFAMNRQTGGASGEIPDPTPDPGKTAVETAQRYAREAAEILNGDRDAFSDPGANPATKVAIMQRVAERNSAPMPTPKGGGGATDTDALKAAQIAANQSAGGGALPYQPKPVTGGNTVMPVKKAPVIPSPFHAKPVNVAPRPIPKPSAGPYVSKPVAPLPAGLPQGYDKAAATRGAPTLAEHLRAKKYDYSRPAVKAWQTSAGLTPDGLYGSQTASTLKTYTTKAPPPMFKG